MELQPAQTQSHPPVSASPDPAMPDLGPLHAQAAAFLQAAEREIERALSRDSQGFMAAIRQQSAQ